MSTAAVSTAASVSAAAMVTRQSVFTAAIMAGIADVTSPIPCLISVEVVKWLRPALRYGSVITVMGIVAVIHMAVKAARAMEPWAGANEYAAREPIRSIVAVGSTIVGRVVEVPIRANRRPAHPDADSNLGLSCGDTTDQRNCKG
jgi:hypothetical protein